MRLDYVFAPTATGSAQTTKIHQGYSNATEYRLEGITLYRATVDNVVDAADTLNFD